MLGRAIIGFIAAALAAAFTPAVLAQQKGQIVRIQDYPGIGNMLYRIAATKGYCEKHGITCQLQMIPSGPLGAQALLAKSIDVAFIGPDIQINAILKGARLKAIVGGVAGNPFLIVIRNDLAAPNAGNGYPAFMADLKGKRIGVPARGAAAEFQFVVLAQKAGLKAEDFTFVAVGSPNTAYGALISKQVDAEMSFPPSDALCDLLKTCRTIYRAYQSRELPQASTNMVVTQETIDKRPDVVDGLIAAAEDSEVFIQEPNNYAEALKIAQSYFKFDMPRGDEVMDAALKRAVPFYKAAISRPAVKAFAEYMLATKQIAAPFGATTLVYAKAP
jgi:NitT/TauT family transport system substrate-binding protein